MKITLNDKIHNIFKSNRKDPKHRIISLWAGLSIVSVILIQRIIRPSHFKLSAFENFLQGTLPNFFSATGLCAIAFLYYKLFVCSEHTKNELLKRLIFASFFAFIGLTLWELIQYFIGFPVDYADILMTAIGCIVTSIFIVIIYKFKSNINTYFL